MNNTTFVYQNPNVTEYSSLMVSIRWELRACGGYSLGKSTLPPTTIEYTNFRLTCRPTLLPPPPPPRLKPHLLLSQQEWGGVGSIDYYEHREAKLCLFVPHGYSTLTFKWGDACGWVAGWLSGRVSEDNDSLEWQWA
jgi:hypothetical protein